MSLLAQYCPRVEFESHADFAANFKINIPADFNFAYDVVDVYAVREPTRRALVWCDDAGKEKIYTFADLSRLSQQIANWLVAQGIKKGDMVMMLTKGRYQWWTLILACHRLGAIAVPGTHMLKKKDLLYRFEVTEAKMIVCAEDAALIKEVDAAIAESGRQIVRASLNEKFAGWQQFDEETAAHAPSFPRPTGDAATHNNDMMLGYFSSGTSGEPKMVAHNFVYPFSHILTAKYWQNVIDGGLHYTVADTGWAKCAWGKIYGQWLCGSAVFVHDYTTFNALDTVEKMIHYGVTTFCAPPTVFRFLIREDLAKYDFSGIKYAVTAGEALNPEVYSQFDRLTGLKLHEAYGQTELTVSVATTPWMQPKPGSIGRGLPGVFVTLLSLDTGRPVEAGEEGEICLRTQPELPYGIFLGYYKADELTRSVWHDGYYHTGDIAWADEDGYLWFVGRADDVIKTSGYRVGPSEVESALMEHPAVLECAATGVPDEVRGNIIKATIVLTKEYAASEELKKELQEHVKHTTAPYKYPRIIEFVSALPKTISGKIRRVQLRQESKS
ncbi:acetyl-CoA synthetase [Planctomycetales bacterium]|nr:acetyl-CoA synthetase [Planctomycetales bacterium]GHS96071.1 acetyl-CoA synthetase [Planctomycetales bacterium]GHT04370.1 acetyl-CoA synthetase [Planctomycetales bacterium]GHV21985.1 acetyl-CoA synthetase [Planctomycetales bacterium]